MYRFSKKKKAKKKIRENYGKLKDEDFSFELIRRYYDRNNAEKCSQDVSEKVCGDLNFEDLFKYVDRTVSPVGQQYMYNRMRKVPEGANYFSDFEYLVSEFQKQEPYRTKIHYELNKLKNADSYYLCDLFQSDQVKPPKWLGLAYVLSLTNILSLILIIFTPQYVLLFLFLTIVNTVLHYSNKKNVFTYLYSFPQLSVLSDVSYRMITKKYIQHTNKIPYRSVTRLRKIQKKLWVFNVSKILQGDPTGLIYAIFELLKIVFLVEPIALFRSLKRIEIHKTDLQEVFEFMGSIEMALSVSSLRYGLPYYCIPEFISPKKEMRFKDIYVPIITSCVSNTLDISKKSILITGSNMSGKTTFMRIVGMNSLMAQTLNTCFAREYTAPWLHIYSAILRNDDLMNSKSFYMEEVLSIKEMIDKSMAGKPHLFLLDEIFKGTNTIERISGGKAVLSWLNRGLNIVFISTHDIELPDLLKEEYNLYHFSEEVQEHTISFDYKIKEGILKSRNAIKILEINGYPKSLVEEARQLSYKFDSRRFSV